MPPESHGPPPPDDDEPVLEALLAAARTGDDRTREEALRALRELVLDAEPEARWRAALREALRDPDPTVRYFAVQGLGRVGDRALLDAVNDPAPPVRREAVALLGSLHDPERQRWVEQLAEELDASLTPPELTLELAVEALRGALEDPSPEVREAAAEAMAAITNLPASAGE